MVLVLHRSNGSAYTAAHNRNDLVDIIGVRRQLQFAEPDAENDRIDYYNG